MQSLSAMVGQVSISDVTLTGSVRRIAGSDDESGSVTLQAMLGGQSLTKLSLGAGQYDELVSVSTTGRHSGTWAGPDRTMHAMAEHNLKTDSSWFFPAFTISKLLVSPATVATLGGQVVRNGISATHVTAYQRFSDAPAQLVAQLQGITQMDIYLDPTTLLPVALDFATHPDNNMLLDIPVEIRFSDYRSVNAVQVPFHVQKYFNGSLFLDIQLQAANLNSGLAASAFTIQ